MDLPDVLEVKPIAKPLNATIRPPGSKSLTNRALVCAALAEGHSTLHGALDSEDTRVMIDCLRKIGIDIRVLDSGKTIEVQGCAGRLEVNSADLFVGNSGTTIRFLTPLVALGNGTVRLDGVPRMRERPIADLLDALAQLGIDARSENENGCPPVVVNAKGIEGGATRVRGSVSSQFLSGLLMAAPCAKAPLQVTLEGALVSQPYIEMTLRVMDAFGVELHVDKNLTRFQFTSSNAYHGCNYTIEPDASAASYFWAAVAITGGTVTVEGLSPSSVQGDIAFVDCLESMGCKVERGGDSITVTGCPLSGITVNMNGISDTVQTLSAVALFADGTTQISGVDHIRHKETDRLAALATELRKLGATIEETGDGLSIQPGKLQPAEIETYDDHRMAMSLALVGLKQAGIKIKNPACVAKTYPEYFSDLRTLCEAH